MYFIRKILVPALCLMLLPLSFTTTIFKKDDLKNDGESCSIAQVIFEDQNICVTEDNQEALLKALKETKSKKIVIFELNDTLSLEDDKSDKSVSMEESKAVLRDHRKKVKDLYSTTNNEILSRMDLELLNASKCYVSEYAPFVYAECDEITSEALTSIMSIAGEDYISVIYIRSDSILK